MRFELEDAKNTIIELKEELNYKNSVNRSLGLQLEKTIESNSELLLEIKDLDDLLQNKELEIEELKAAIRQTERNARVEDEKVLLELKLKESDATRTGLEEQISILETQKKQVVDDTIQKLRTENDILRKEIENTDKEVANVSKENMNLLSQLLILHQQIEEKNTSMENLEATISAEKNQLAMQVETLKKEKTELEASVDDLKEKLRFSEELSKSQIDSNKVFMEDLISNVERLEDRNDQLETLTKSSEEKNYHLIQQLEAQKKELLEHEKERSLLLSQRGQLKSLREKIVTVTENYQSAVKRQEDLEKSIEALKDENCKNITSLNVQIMNLKEKLHVADAEILALKPDAQIAESQSAEASEKVNLLSVAKEAAEAKASSLDAALTELKKQYDSLLEKQAKTSASMNSLQIAHAELEESFTDAQHRYDEIICQLQERDVKIIELTDTLNSVEKHCKSQNMKESEYKTKMTELASLQAAYAGLEDGFKDAQDRCSELICQLHERDVNIIQLTKALDSAETERKNACSKTSESDIKITELTMALNSAEIKLKKAYEKISELESTILASKEELDRMKEDKMLRNSCIKELEIQLARARESADETKIILSRTDEEVRKLQVRNNDMSMLLESAVAYKEDMLSRLESSLAKELELEEKLQTTQKTLQEMENGRSLFGKSTERNDRKHQLKDKRSRSMTGEELDLDEQHRNLYTELEDLKCAVQDMKGEKEKAERSLQKSQASNTSLTVELKKWKAKVKAANEELFFLKEKSTTSNSAGTSSEERSSTDSCTKDMNKSTDFDQRNEILKVRKQSTELRRKLLAQEEEKEEIKKKLLSVQKELQRKSELLHLSEKRHKEKEKVQRADQRPPTRHSLTSLRIGMMDSSIAQREKNMEDLLERVKLLERELNIKTIELEATQFLLKTKEAGSDINPHLEKHDGTWGQTQRLQGDFQESSPKANIMDVSSQKIAQHEEQTLQTENQIVKNPLQPKENERQCTATDQYYLQRAMNESEDNRTKMTKGIHLEEELQEMKYSYSQLSLQFAELEVEKEQLSLSVKSLFRSATTRF
ncbi:hypothetical protein KP509_23G020900 [Ceratopteris richardii]|nr:hypothetical protein KP509_23G020900 [Ceratopteris richardii]